MRKKYNIIMIIIWIYDAASIFIPYSDTLPVIHNCIYLYNIMSYPLYNIHYTTLSKVTVIRSNDDYSLLYAYRMIGFIIYYTLLLHTFNWMYNLWIQQRPCMWTLDNNIFRSLVGVMTCRIYLIYLNSSRRLCYEHTKFCRNYTAVLIPQRLFCSHNLKSGRHFDFKYQTLQDFVSHL